jgi:hypothetical protein
MPGTSGFDLYRQSTRCVSRFGGGRGTSLRPCAFPVSSYLCRLADVKNRAVRDAIAAGDRTHSSPSRSRRRIASRFWCSVNFGLRPRLTRPAFVRSRARADQYNYDLFGVVKENAVPTLNPQRLIMAEYECVFEMIYQVLRAVGRTASGFISHVMHSSAALQRLSSATMSCPLPPSPKR